MAASGWKLTVTFLGARDSAREVLVRADNWPAALRAGRRELGEEGGVPPGASCAVAADGVVTLLDGTQRRRYVLTPLGDRVASGEQTPDAAAALASGPTMPAPARAESHDAAESVRRSKQTLDYSPERAEALRREYETARARSSFPPAANLPPFAPLASASPSVPTSDPPAASPGLPRPSLHAVASVDAGRSSSLPPPAAELRAAAPRASAELPKARPVGSVYGLRGDGLTLVASRDLEPTPSSPLTYRERAYLLGGKSDRVRLEVLLQAELACLRRELAGHPRGQFVRLGVFTESFDKTPEQPPLATLEWKDWRGRAVFQMSGEIAVATRGAFPDPAAGEVAHEQAAAALGAPAPLGSAGAPAVAAEVYPPAPPAPPAAAPPKPPPSGLPSLAEPRETSAASGAIEPHELWSEGRPSDHPRLNEREGHSEPDVRLAAAFESMPDLYLLPTPLTGLEFTVELLSRLVPCEAISACLYDVNTDEFRFVALSGLGALERKASAVAASAGLFGVAQRKLGEALLVPDVAKEPRYNSAVDGRPSVDVRSLAYVPVRHQGQLLGMLQLINRELHGKFAASDVSVLTYVSAQLGEFLANCRALSE